MDSNEFPEDRCHLLLGVDMGNDKLYYSKLLSAPSRTPLVEHLSPPSILMHNPDGRDETSVIFKLGCQEQGMGDDMIRYGNYKMRPTMQTLHCTMAADVQERLHQVINLTPDKYSLTRPTAEAVRCLMQWVWKGLNSDTWVWETSATGSLGISIMFAYPAYWDPKVWQDLGREQAWKDLSKAFETKLDHCCSAMIPEQNALALGMLRQSGRLLKDRDCKDWLPQDDKYALIVNCGSLIVNGVIAPATLANFDPKKTTLQGCFKVAGGACIDYEFEKLLRGACHEKFTQKKCEHEPNKSAFDSDIKKAVGSWTEQREGFTRGKSLEFEIFDQPVSMQWNQLEPLFATTERETISLVFELMQRQRDNNEPLPQTFILCGSMSKCPIFRDSICTKFKDEYHDMRIITPEVNKKKEFCNVVSRGALLSLIQQST